MIAFRNNVRHELSENISQKASYFSDVFEFSVENSGNSSYPQLENQLSLFKSIEIQLSNWVPYHSKKNIQRHFRHHLLHINDEIIKAICRTEFSEINQLKSQLNDDSSRAKLQNLARRLIRKLDHNLLQYCVDNIIRVLECSENLSAHDHIKELNYYVPIVIAEYVSHGFSEDEINPKNS